MVAVDSPHCEAWGEVLAWVWPGGWDQAGQLQILSPHGPAAYFNLGCWPGCPPWPGHTVTSATRPFPIWFLGP